VTRIAIVKRAEMNEEQGRVFDAAEKSGNPTGGPYWAYIRYPKLMQAAQDMGGAVRAGPLPARVRQIAVLTAVRHWNARFPWAAQVRASLQAGVDQATIDAINAGKTPDLAEPRERMAYQLARELLANKGLSDSTYKEAERLFKPDELVTLVAAVGQFSMVSCTANAFDITPPEGAPAMLPG
jgi:4-carboxymuconolactone decarboxylase